MKRLIAIAKDPNIKVASTSYEYLSPAYIYIPIKATDKLLIEKKEIQKSTPLFEQNKRKIYSPISGKVEKIITRKNVLQEDTNYLVIKNDFQENDDYKGSSTTMIIKTDMPKKIKENLSVAPRFQKKKKLILNGIEDEPYLATKLFIHSNHTLEILLMLDLLSTSFEIPEIEIFLKEMDRESIENFEHYMNTYPNIKIKILPDYYPMAHPKIFKEYNDLREEDVVVTTEEILDLYYEIIKSRKKDFLYVTLTGNAILNPQVVKVKVGTPLKEVAKDLLKWTSDTYEVYINSIMNGILAKTEDIILTEEIRGIYFMKTEKKKSTSCIHCGKCIQICPMKCNPYECVITKGKKEAPNCIHCGLCTFICPSYIELEKYLKGENNEK